MTTIAYRDGVLAAESLITASWTKVGAEVKIWRNKDGMLAGTCGDCADGEMFRKWFMRGAKGKPPEFEEDSEAIIVRRSGRVEWVGRNRAKTKVNAPFYAIGSGFRVALGAMAAGASAEKAVEIACEYDCGSGGPVHVLKLCS